MGERVAHALALERLEHGLDRERADGRDRERGEWDRGLDDAALEERDLGGDDEQPRERRARS